MDKSIFYSQPNVRSFHNSCAKQVELGRVSWLHLSYFKAQVYFKHSYICVKPAVKEKNQEICLFSLTKEFKSKSKEAYCKAWNYSAKCNCLQFEVSYKETHL